MVRALSITFVFTRRRKILRARLPKKEKPSSIAHRRAAIRHPDQERGGEAKHGCRCDGEGADLHAGNRSDVQVLETRGRAFRATNKKFLIAVRKDLLDV